MRNTYVDGPDGDSTGCWGVGYTGEPLNDVLIQVLSYATSTQTRIRIDPPEALRLAAALADGAQAAMAGLQVEWGSSDGPWLVSVGADGGGCVTLALHDEEGANGDRRTQLDIPAEGVPHVVEELAARAIQMLDDRRAAAAGRKD